MRFLGQDKRLEQTIDSMVGVLANPIVGKVITEETT
jgi:hypothetical protein